MWARQKRELARNPKLDHQRSLEYGSRIMEAIETDVPYRIGGNVMNTGLVSNLPAKACVEVPCMVDGNGVQGCHVGAMPSAKRLPLYDAAEPCALGRQHGRPVSFRRFSGTLPVFSPPIPRAST